MRRSQEALLLALAVVLCAALVVESNITAESFENEEGETVFVDVEEEDQEDDGINIDEDSDDPELSSPTIVEPLRTSALKTIDSLADVQVASHKPSKCPHDSRWGGAGLYCHGSNLVYCTHPKDVGYIVDACTQGCVVAKRGYADYCSGKNAVSYNAAIANGTAQAAAEPPVHVNAKKHHHHHHHHKHNNNKHNNNNATAATHHHHHVKHNSNKKNTTHHHHHHHHDKKKTAAKKKQHHPHTFKFVPTPAFMSCIGVDDAHASAYALGLHEALERFEMTNFEAIKAFIGTCAAATHGWKHHTHHNGQNHHDELSVGRGMLPITNHQYAAAGKYFHEPFSVNPHMVSQQPWAFLTAGWLWQRTAECFAHGTSIECARKCAAAHFFRHKYVKHAHCGVLVHGWRDVTDETRRVDRCFGTHHGSTPKYAHALGGQCGPNGEGKCGSITGLPRTAYWDGYCSDTDYYCLKPVSGPLHGKHRYDPCGPGGVAGTSACDVASSCVNGYWHGYCGGKKSAFHCCKP